MPRSLPVVSDCHNCGVCCLHIGHPPFVMPTEDQPGEHWWQVLPDDLRAELEIVMAEYQTPAYDGTVDSLDGACCWYDLTTRRCLHHQHRPNVCRDFQPGSKDCLAWRAHYQVDSR